MNDRRMLRWVGILTLGSLATLPAHAGSTTTWIVDSSGGAGSDFTSIQTALFSTAPDDLVLVRSGVYSGFNLLNQGVRLVAEPGSIVQVNGTTLVAGIPAGDSVVISGIRFADFNAFSSRALVVQECEGEVVLQDCVFQAAASVLFPGNGVSVVDSAAVVILDSTLENTPAGCTSLPACEQGGIGLLTSNSTTYVIRSTVSGGDGASYGVSVQPNTGGAGGAGVRVVGGTLYVEGSAIEGGRGGMGASGMFAGGLCGAGGLGGAGIHLFSEDPLVTVRASEVEGGLGGSAGVCPDPGMVQGSSGPFLVDSGQLVQLPGDARQHDAPSVAREGVAGAISFEGGPNELVWWILSPHPDPIFFAVLNGTLVPEGPVLISFLGFTGATGELVLSFTVPELGPNSPSAQLVSQGVHYDVGQLEIGLTNARVITLLDSATP